MTARLELYPRVPLLVRRIANRLVRPLGINPFPRAFEYALGATSKAKMFDEIYARNLWGSGESASGVGSDLAATKRYRGALVALLRHYQFQSLFDAPCGDMNWMPAVMEQAPLRYQGGDISAALVARLIQKYPEFSIRMFDICHDEFPQVDVWHCRDCLFHLSFADIRAALQRFAASRIPYVLLTTHRARWLHRNLDITGVGFRMLDFERAPFNFPQPLAVLPDFRRGLDFPRYMALWPRQAIVDALAAMDCHE